MAIRFVQFRGEKLTLSFYLVGQVSQLPAPVNVAHKPLSSFCRSQPWTSSTTTAADDENKTDVDAEWVISLHRPLLLVEKWVGWRYNGHVYGESVINESSTIEDLEIFDLTS